MRCVDPCRRCGAYLPAGGRDLRVCSGCRRALFRAYDLHPGDAVTTLERGTAAPPGRFVGYDVRDGTTLAAVRRGPTWTFVPVEEVWRVLPRGLVRPCTGERAPAPPRRMGPPGFEPGTDGL